MSIRQAPNAANARSPSRLSLTSPAKRTSCPSDASADPTFAAALAERWPLLLIDEFQDTDPRQWDIFSRIHDASDPEQRLLCLIGDPKQAIYRFRGGDLATYLRARDRVRRS